MKEDKTKSSTTKKDIKLTTEFKGVTYKSWKEFQDAFKYHSK